LVSGRGDLLVTCMRSLFRFSVFFFESLLVNEIDDDDYLLRRSLCWTFSSFFVFCAHDTVFIISFQCRALLCFLCRRRFPKFIFPFSVQLFVRSRSHSALGLEFSLFRLPVLFLTTLSLRRRFRFCFTPSSISLSHGGTSYAWTYSRRETTYPRKSRRREKTQRQTNRRRSEGRLQTPSIA
jgi:hypothetical protein